MKTARRLHHDHLKSLKDCDSIDVWRSIAPQSPWAIDCLSCRRHPVDKHVVHLLSYVYILGERYGWIRELKDLMHFFGDRWAFEHEILNLDLDEGTGECGHFSFYWLATNLIHHGVTTPEDLFHLLLHEQTWLRGIYWRYRKPLVRVFLSSTFASMAQERRAVCSLVAKTPRLAVQNPIASAPDDWCTIHDIGVLVKASHIHCFLIGSDPGSPWHNRMTWALYGKTFTQVEWRLAWDRRRPLFVYFNEDWRQSIPERVRMWEGEGFRFHIDHSSRKSAFGGRLEPECDGSCWHPIPGWEGACRQKYYVDLLERAAGPARWSLDDFRELNWLQFSVDILGTNGILIQTCREPVSLAERLVADVAAIPWWKLPSVPHPDALRFAHQNEKDHPELPPDPRQESTGGSSQEVEGEFRRFRRDGSA